MTASSPINLQVHNAEQFKESVSEPAPNTKIYLTFGRINAWDDENSPDAANSSVATTNEIWHNMIGAKRITEYDIRHVIPRYDWTSNTKYIAYDDLATGLHEDNVKFYVMNSNYSVYKCIANNSSQNSTVEPTSTNPNILSQTTDGYIWKYMYTISDSAKLRFVTDNFIPVKTLGSNDGSQQWSVQENTIDGAINTIIITNSGVGYNTAPTITITGDGTGATAVAGINNVSNTVNSISMVTFGSDYTYASAVLEHPFGSGGVIRPIISPKGGHGSDALYELGGKYLMFNPKLNNSEGGVFPILNEYRQIALIKDILLFDSNTVASNTVLSQTMDIVVNGSGPDYIADEIVFQGASLALATFRAKVLDYNNLANNTLKLVDVVGTPTSDGLIGATSVANKFVISVDYPDLQPYSGKVLYSDNFKPITRDSSQAEDFKIIFKF
jgi:hypothetical protein